MPRDGAQCQLFCRVEAFVALRLRKQIVDSGWHWRLVRQWAFETRDQDTSGQAASATHHLDRFP